MQRSLDFFVNKYDFKMASDKIIFVLQCSQNYRFSKFPELWSLINQYSQKSTDESEMKYCLNRRW